MSGDCLYFCDLVRDEAVNKDDSEDEGVEEVEEEEELGSDSDSDDEYNKLIVRELPYFWTFL